MHLNVLWGHTLFTFSMKTASQRIIHIIFCAVEVCDDIGVCFIHKKIFSNTVLLTSPMQKQAHNEISFMESITSISFNI